MLKKIRSSLALTAKSRWKWTHWTPERKSIPTLRTQNDRMIVVYLCIVELTSKNFHIENSREYSSAWCGCNPRLIYFRLWTQKGPLFLSIMSIFWKIEFILGKAWFLGRVPISLKNLAKRIEDNDGHFQNQRSAWEPI